MWGRFYKQLDKEYANMFEDKFVLGFCQISDEKKFYALLSKAIKRGSVVTDEEIISLVGKATYDYARETQHLVEGVDYF